MLPLLPLNLSRSSGVTLMELLIGLVIVSIGMTVAVPSFQGMIARNTVAT
ncbi:MAG: prepilin-type N-terminal cleavage/methylation domain-containing protein, partial [Candidatus Azotimanducaceae bacterium]